MTQFRRYESLKHINHRAVEGIDIGTVYIFPKLDGANAQIWMDEIGQLCWGSRNRCVGVLTENVTDETLDDLQGLGRWVVDHRTALQDFFFLNPKCRLYGEWLVRHTLKTYRESAWNQFYAFDVYHDGTGKYLPFENWSSIVADELGIPVVYPLCIIENPSEGQIRHQVDVNTYLIEDGAGIGEGIVVKNYEWVALDGKQTWMKVVRNEFKEDSKREFGTTEIGGEFQVEVAIAERYVTPELVGKVRAKILFDIDQREGISKVDPANWQQIIAAENRGELIPRLLETVFHDLIEDFIWLAIKDMKNPTIDFKRLRAQSIAQTKKFAMDLF